MQQCCSLTSAQSLTCAHQTQKSLHTLACNSLSWGTVAVIFVAITLIRGKHTDGVDSQTHRLRIKMSSLPELVMVWENILKKIRNKKINCSTLSHSLVFIFQTSFFSPSETDIKWPFLLDEKNRVFSGETMVLVYHMLHLNAVRQLWSLSVPGCGPAPRRSLLLVGKCFQWEQEEATFHGATSRCRTQRMRWMHLGVWACVCIFPCVCHYFTTFVVKHNLCRYL